MIATALLAAALAFPAPAPQDPETQDVYDLIDRIRGSYDGLFAPPTPTEVIDVEVLLEFERQAAVEAYERLVFEPVQEAFDEMLESSAGR